MIFIKDFKKITDTKYSIGYTHYMPYDPINGLIRNEGDVLPVGKLTELPLELNPIEGKYLVMYYNPVTNTCFWEYENVPVPPATETELLKERLQSLEQSNAEMMNLITMMATPTV